MSFREFSYQLRGFDFYTSSQKNCRLQMGGSDQWGNIKPDSMIRKVTGEAALVCPLITKADGGKFGNESEMWWIVAIPHPMFYRRLNATTMQ